VLPEVVAGAVAKRLAGQKAQSLQSYMLDPAPAPISPRKRHRQARSRSWPGPRAAFSADEREQMRRAKVVAVRLGPRILRTETAGLGVP